MTDFFRFPHTAHLAWLGQGRPREDKVLASGEASALLAEELVVEEKIDGANLGFSTTEDGDLRAQNRGGYLSPATGHPQFRALWAWLAPRRERIIDALWPHLMLFGEWCYAVHSVRYDRLPDWFVGFDVFDRAAGRFWDTLRRDALLDRVGLASVPRVARGHYTLEGLRELFAVSQFGSEPFEGVVARAELGGWTTARAKLVRAEFTQAIGEHWSKRPLQRNTLATGVAAWP